MVPVEIADHFSRVLHDSLNGLDLIDLFHLCSGHSPAVMDLINHFIRRNALHQTQPQNACIIDHHHNKKQKTSLS